MPLDYLFIALTLALYTPVVFLLTRRTRISNTIWVLAFGGTLILLASQVTWQAISPTGEVHSFVFFLTAMLGWKYITADYDVTLADVTLAQVPFRAKLALGAATILAFFQPCFVGVCLYIAINYLDAWTHHAMMPIRILKIFVAYCIVYAVGHALALISGPSAMAFWFLALCFEASHYFVPGFGKIRLGKHWYSWITENPTYVIAVSAYGKGWARFIPPEQFLKLPKTLKPLTPYLNALTLIIECGTAFSLANRELCLLLLIGCCAMHLVIFSTAGLLFWEFIVTDLLLAVHILSLDASTTSTLFNLQNGVLLAAILVLFPLKKRIWHPARLAWWETPFSACMDWFVVGISGKVYGLHNDFMSPFERLYAQDYGFFMSDQKMVTKNLGAVLRWQWRDELLASKGDAATIAAIRDKYGRTQRDAARETQHVHYLTQFFKNLNRGARKNILPTWLYWLRAPGGHWFSWGDTESYHRQEPVKQVRIFYRDYYYDHSHDEILTLTNELVRTIDIESD